MTKSDRTGKDNMFPLEDYVVHDLQDFAQNIARLAEETGKAASAWSQPREKGERRDNLVQPMSELVSTFSKVSGSWLADPTRVLDAQTQLYAGYLSIWANTARRLSGKPAAETVTPEAGDRRFKDPEWQKNAYFDYLKQVYLLTSRWAADVIENVDGLDGHTRHKASFYMKQIANAISPSNFIATNPELFRETMASSGENLVRGMHMLAEDIAAGKGELKLRQSDSSRFEVGRNLATTPGKVIARSELAEIIQYEATTGKVLKRPLLICPPWINKFYILDLNEEKSFIRWAVSQGHTVFVISWVNPDHRHARKGWESYIREGLQFALGSIEKATGEREVNAIGYCVGGTLLSAALALMVREGDERIRSATLFTTQTDFEQAGDLKVYVDESQILAIEEAMQDDGYLEGTKMAMAFNMLRSGDLVWPYFINTYLKGNDPSPFDLLYWNADSTRMSAANHSFYLRNCYLDNNLAKGEMELAGYRISLADIQIPIYNLATREDHIAPAVSVFEGSRLFGGPVTYVLAGSGHIAGVVNPPDKGKYQYWTGPAPRGEFGAWLEAADEHPGSWWPNWQAWIDSQDKRKVPARTIGSGSLKPLGDAPGSYVKVRS